MIRLSLVLAFALGQTASAQVPSKAAVQSLLDSVVPAAMQVEQIPGAVVAVVSGGRIVAVRGYGVADLDTRRPMTGVDDHPNWLDQ